MEIATKVKFDNIRATFTGEDGGVSYIKLKSFLEELDKRAQAGDKKAPEVILIMTRFSDMIDLVNHVM